MISTTYAGDAKDDWQMVISMQLDADCPADVLMKVLCGYLLLSLVLKTFSILLSSNWFVIWLVDEN